MRWINLKDFRGGRFAYKLVRTKLIDRFTCDDAVPWKYNIEKWVNQGFEIESHNKS